MSTPLLADALRERDGILFTRGAEASDPYRERWDEEAAADHVRSATARSAGAEPDFEALTQKISPLLRGFPAGRHFARVLELGCGYGRVPLYLAQARGLSCETYYGLDISAAMLRHLERYRRRFGLFPEADVKLVCGSVDELPLASDSVDLILSSAVFLHMGKGFVRRALAEAGRVLTPGGAFVFDSSFPNRWCPANAPSALASKLPGRPPHVLKYYSLRELERLFGPSELVRKARGLVLEPSSFAILPRTLGPVSIPLARRVNARAAAPPERLRPLLGLTFHASGGLAGRHRG